MNCKSKGKMFNKLVRNSNFCAWLSNKNHLNFLCEIIQIIPWESVFRTVQRFSGSIFLHNGIKKCFQRGLKVYLIERYRTTVTALFVLFNSLSQFLCINANLALVVIKTDFSFSFQIPLIFYTGT